MRGYLPQEFFQYLIDPVQIPNAQCRAGDQPETINIASDNGYISFNAALFVAQLRIGCATYGLVDVGDRQILQKSTGLAAADLKFGERCQ